MEDGVKELNSDMKFVRAELAKIKGMVRGVEGRLTGMEGRFTSMEGRFDPARRRARMKAAFASGLQVIEAELHMIGCVGVADGEIHGLYLEPTSQGRGSGAAVVREILSAHLPQPWRVEVLRDSPARRFWECQGFVLVEEKPFDRVLGRPAD